MSYPKDASVNEKVLRAAITYRQNGGELSDGERLEVPAYVRRVAGPLPPRRRELSPIVGVAIGWLLAALVWLLAADTLLVWLGVK